MTIKQRKAARILVENGGNISDAMRKAGYSPQTAKTPQKLTESKAWPQLLEEILPDDKLLNTHAAALDANKWNDFTGEREPDHMTRLKAVDLGYKVKHKIGENNVNIFGEKVVAILGGASNVPTNNGIKETSTTS